jgi:hypothetical protein
MVIGIVNGGIRYTDSLNFITPSKACVEFMDYIRELLEYKNTE